MNVTSALSQDADGLSVSIVVYRPDAVQLEQTLVSLGTACAHLRAASPTCPVDLYLVDNGGLGDVGAVTRRLDAQGVRSARVKLVVVSVMLPMALYRSSAYTF